MWRCEEADLQMWRWEDVDLQMSGCEDVDQQMSGYEDVDQQMWRCEDVDLQMWRCEDVDLQMWRCEDVDQQMRRCEDVDLQMWRCEDVDQQMWRCEDVDQQMWRCEDVDQQMWRCEGVIQRLLFYEEPFAGALGKKCCNYRDFCYQTKTTHSKYHGIGLPEAQKHMYLRCFFLGGFCPENITKMRRHHLFGDFRTLRDWEKAAGVTATTTRRTRTWRRRRRKRRRERRRRGSRITKMTKRCVASWLQAAVWKEHHTVRAERMNNTNAHTTIQNPYGIAGVRSSAIILIHINSINSAMCEAPLARNTWGSAFQLKGVCGVWSGFWIGHVKDFHSMAESLCPKQHG